MTAELSPLCQAAATELIDMYREGTVSPVDVTEAVLDRIEARDAELNAFVLIDREAAINSAKASEKRWRDKAPLGQLDGIPVTVKDMILTKGWPTLRGSKAVDPAGPWDEDSPSVARLRENGAVLTGKTTMAEFGWKGTGDCPLNGVTLNPVAPGKTPGGSSSGAAAALADFMGPLALGTDAGGSVRIPASFTGTVGFKATFGAIPNLPASPMGTLSNVGPMARTVADTKLLFDAISAPDRRDPWTLSQLERKQETRTLKDLRIALITNSPSPRRVEPEVLSVTRDAANAISNAGAIIEEVDGTFLEESRSSLLTLWRSGAAYLANMISRDKIELLDAGLQREMELGKDLLGSDFVSAEQARWRVCSKINQLFDSFDVILTPTVATPPPDLGSDLYDPTQEQHWMDWTPFTFPFNLSRHPAISVPFGTTEAGIPIGVHLVMPHGADYRLLSVAQLVEALGR
ncbi:amidase [Roseibium sp. SCP14]|uniref:amidase n=1 Tax=Roseibium sp. SCP14 TaxID=3141375 RepID=UPI00333B2A50